MRGARGSLGLVAGILALGGIPASSSALDEESAAAVMAPHPAAILGSPLRETPVLALGPECREPLQGELRSALDAAGAPGDEAADRERLRAALAEGPAAGAAACGWQLLARVELVLGLLPEAAGSARRAADAARDAQAAKQVAWSELLLAEAFYRSGRRDAAEPLYEGLARSGDAQLAAAAALRLADLAFDRGTAAACHGAYERLLHDAGRIGIDPLGWAPRAAEAAIAVGNLVSARVWLERLASDLTRPADALSAIRLADLAFAQGRVEEARNRLTDVDAAQGDAGPGLLARVRLLDLGLEKGDARRARDALRGMAAERVAPGLVAYARLVLARRLIDEQRLDDALAHLTRLSHDASVPELVEPVRRELRRAVQRSEQQAGDDAGCLLLVTRLGARREWLMRSVADPAPFLRLGGCYESLGLGRPALDTYRELARAFGPSLADTLSLPLARASLAVGERETARSAAAVRVAASGGTDSAWSMLLAEIELADGAAEAAADRLAKLVAQAPPGGEPERALLLLARAASDAAGGSELRRLLFERITARPAPASGQEARDEEEMALIAGGLYRRAGESAPAVTLYTRALATLWPGAERTQALFWLGALAAPSQAARAALAEAAAADSGTFAALARARLALESLRGGLVPESGRSEGLPSGGPRPGGAAS